MCNEFAQERAWRAYCEMMALEARDIVTPEPPALPSGSVHPSERAAIISAAPGGSRLDLLPWGWTPRERKGLIINIRAEGRRDPPSARCLAPVDRFYEFRGAKAPKSKFEFTPITNEPLAFAVIRREDAFALLTCEPGEDVQEIHGRQPVTLRAADWSDWLTRPAWPGELIAPSPAGTFQALQVR